jgi:hypothetical protein
MNPTVMIRLAFAAVWLGLAVYFLFSPAVQLGGLDLRLAGWAALALMVWNLARAYFAWMSVRNKETLDDRRGGS